MSSREVDLIRIVTDRGRPSSERASVAEVLGRSQYNAAIPVLLQIASDDTESEQVLAATGVALARLYMAQDALLDAPLHDFMAAAYLAFDETVARAQSGEE